MSKGHNSHFVEGGILGMGGLCLNIGSKNNYICVKKKLKHLILYILKNHPLRWWRCSYCFAFTFFDLCVHVWLVRAACAKKKALLYG